MAFFVAQEKSGRSGIIGSRETKLYQWFASSNQEVFILNNIKTERYTAQTEIELCFP